jgi:hypothetical protein
MMSNLSDFAVNDVGACLQAILLLPSSVAKVSTVSDAMADEMENRSRACSGPQGGLDLVSLTPAKRKNMHYSS